MNIPNMREKMKIILVYSIAGFFFEGVICSRYMKLFVGWLKHGSGYIPWFPCSLVDVATLLVLILVVSTCFNYLFSLANVHKYWHWRNLRIVVDSNTSYFYIHSHEKILSWDGGWRTYYDFYSVVTSTFTPISFFISLFRFRHNLQYHNLQKLFHFGVSLGNASVVTRWKAQVIQ